MTPARFAARRGPMEHGSHGSAGLRSACLALSSLMIGAIAWADLALSQEDPTDIVAAAVRQRGYQCEQPEGARPDPDNTSPDEKAWIIRCENATFRVKFMGDTGAKVEPVSQ